MSPDSGQLKVVKQTGMVIPIPRRRTSQSANTKTSPKTRLTKSVDETDV